MVNSSLLEALQLIYPAVSLIEDQEKRLEQLLQHLSEANPHRTYALVIDCGAAMKRRSWVNGSEQR